MKSIEKEYRPSLVIGLGLMLLLVVIMGISLSCLVRFQNIQITELEKDLANEWQEDHAIRLYLAELDERLEALEEKPRIEIVKIEDGRIDDLQSQIVWLEDLIHLHSHTDVWLEIDYIREVCESPCRRDKIITPD